MSGANDLFDNGSLPHEEVVSIKNSGIEYLLKKSQLGRKKARKVVQSVQSQGSTSNVFTIGGSQLNMLLPLGASNQIDVCEDMVLELVVTNGDAVGGHTLTLCPVASWFSNLNIECSGTILENLYFENMLLDETYWQENDEHILANQTLENYVYSNSTGYTSSAVTIAPSASQTFYLNLNNCITRCALFLPAINSQITIQAIFNQIPYITTSVSTTVSLTSARIIMSGYQYEQGIRNKLIERFQNNVTAYQYLLPQREIVSNASMSSATTSYVQLTGFSGMAIAALFVGLRTVNAAQEALYAFDTVANVDMKSSGQSVFLQALPYAEYRKMGLRTCPNSAPFAERMFMLPFSTDAYESVVDGKNLGFLRFNPNIALEILDTVTASKDVVCIAYQYNRILIKNGQLIREGL